MKSVLTIKFLLFFFCFGATAQKKYELGLHFSPIKQSAHVRNPHTVLRERYIPAESLTTEFGAYFLHKLNTKFNIVHSVNMGFVWHTTLSNFIDSFGSYKVYSGSEEFFYLGYLPKLEYLIIKNRFKVQAGIGVKYLSQYSDIGTGGRGNYLDSTILTEYAPAKGSFNNPISNPINFQVSSELGLRYDIFFLKKKLILGINPFYKHNFTKSYTGVYQIKNPLIKEEGSYYNYAHQRGVRLNLGWKF